MDSTPASNRLHPIGTARRESSPLAPAFVVSAPGKVIVFGEHAVVHGKAAIAAAISLRSYLLVTTLSSSQRTVTLCFQDIELEHTWAIDSLPWSTFSDPACRFDFDRPVTSISAAFTDAMQPYLDSVSPDVHPKQRKVHQAAAATFLYLYLSLGTAASAGCVYTLRSTIPIGAGLGSSASISVCISTALLLQNHAIQPPQTDPEGAQRDLARINHWAFLGEVLLHGNPSGVDNTVSTQGKAVIFKRTDYGKPPTVASLDYFPELSLLLVDTQEPKSTAAQVAKVAALKKRQPQIIDCILDAIDNVTESAHTLIADAKFDSAGPASIAALGELIALNHGLLYTLGVSHPRLERLKEIIDRSEIGWTKLTGSGGGGCAFTLLKTSEKLGPLETELEQEGFVQYATTLGGEGVGVLMPSDVNPASSTPVKGIDQASFCAAPGKAGVDELVGAARHWKYWSC